jgi:hypothetical protein
LVIVRCDGGDDGHGKDGQCRDAAHGRGDR